MFATPAFAQGAAAAQSGGATSTILFFGQLALLLVAFYFLMIRRQQRRAKQHRDALAAIKKGDTVVTAGGLVAKVTRVEDEHLELELAPQVKVRAVKSTISQVQAPAGAKPAND